uniref:Histocompatibility 2, T region locus 13 n=1 Tax=Mus musculus TaxID=10090 RepID=V9GXY0_MOUSE
MAQRTLFLLLAAALTMIETRADRSVPARPRGAPVHLCRLRGQHAVRELRQRCGESEI